jgi:hypothetical protein
MMSMECKMRIEVFLNNSKYSQNVKNGGLPYLINIWRQVCRDLPYNEDYLIDEYLNDISTRNIIQSIQENCNIDTDTIKQLNETDNLFKNKTIETDKSIWGADKYKNDYNNIQHWYYFRVPPERIPDWFSINRWETVYRKPPM